MIAMSTLDNLLEWLSSSGDVAFFDATNSTVKRRSDITRRVEECGRRSNSVPMRVLFLETLCDDPVILESNLLNKVRTSPDFAGMTEEEGIADLKRRLTYYESIYESLRPSEGSFIKLLNMSSYVVTNQVFGRLSRSVLPFVCAIHTSQRPIFLTALVPTHTEKLFASQRSAWQLVSSSFNEGEAADADLAKRLAAWVQKQAFQGKHLCVLASTTPAALEASAAVVEASGCSVTQQSMLNPMDLGTDPGTLRQEIDKFTSRINGGESYEDLVQRLEPCLLEMEGSTDPVLVIAHAMPCRALRAYFLGLPVTKCMESDSSEAAGALADARPCVLELNPVRGRFQEIIHVLDPVP